MRKLWTPTEIETLTKLWKRDDLRTADIAEMLGRPLPATRMKAHSLGLPRKTDPHKIRLTREQELWLIRNFPHMRTEICATYLRISMRSCVRQARRLGLEKTPQFMKETQAVTSRLAKESQLRNGTYPPKGVVNDNLKKGEKFRFKPGQRPICRGDRKKKTNTEQNY